jgi:transcriptional regulator with XRE-family HTH domain
MPPEADPLDLLIGRRIRLLRRAKRMSLAVLGAAVGVAGQQVSKYERALDRVPASRLYRIALALGVPVALFFELEKGGRGGTKQRMLQFWRRRRERADLARADASTRYL